MLCALIMAGGKGTRFWPISTEEKPKQFLKLIGDETMIQTTVNRILPIIPIERIFISTSETYVHFIQEQLPKLPKRNIIVETEGRNTAPCITLSALVIKKYYKDANMLVLPADHLIKDENEFREIIDEANGYLENNKKAIITLGMKPNRAETGYGYIRHRDEKFTLNKNYISKVYKFIEKPDLETAKIYLEDGRYLWNSGMFLWSIENILNEVKTYLPNTYKALKEIENLKEDELQPFINREYSKTDSISVDYGILEKSHEIYVIPCEIGWDDVGTWKAVERYREKDERGNIHVGKIKAVDASNNLIIASNQEVIVDGVSDIYVIENDGRVIVGNKENVSNIKELKTIV